MKRKLSRILSSVMLMFGMACLLSGCFGAASTVQEKTAAIGVINIDAAVLAHPKNQELDKLQQQYRALEEKLALLAETASRAAENTAAGAASANPAEQEFNAKMAAKQEDIQERFNKKLSGELAKANEMLQVYGDQLEKEMQPELFSLQLKMNTLQNSPAELTQLNGRVETLKKDFQDKMAARHAQLNAQIDQAMLPEKQAMEKELTDYAAQLSQELQARSAAQRAESVRLQQNLPLSEDAEAVQRALGMKRQEIATLQEFIINDVRSKAAKIAAEKNLESLLAGYRVNVTATDITDAVIAEIKK